MYSNLIEMQHIGVFEGRLVQATYEVINEVIVITGVKVLTAGNWEEQTGEVLKSLSQRMIEEYGDEMVALAR